MKLSEKIVLFQKLNNESDLRVEFFYDVLKKCNGLKSNYYEYMTTAPVNCDKELLRLPTADYDLCCALLTMLLREDHFINGSFDRRQRCGQVRPIIERIIKLLASKNPTHINGFSEKALDALNGFYVYALIDPRDGKVFYIGKGTGNRVFSHEFESEKSHESEKKKLQKIREIENAGFFVKRLIVNWGLSENEAFVAEATLINLLNYIYFTCKNYNILDEEGRFYLNKSIANLKVNQSAQNPITYLSPEIHELKYHALSHH